MSKSPVALRQCADKVKAETIRIRLAAAGIQAYVTGTDTATALGMGGAATHHLVQVKVHHADHALAVAILEEDDRRLLEAGPWICSRCQEQNEAAFDVCWSCEKPRTDEDERGRIGEAAPSVAEAELGSTINVDRHHDVSDDSNPYRPVVMEDRPPARREHSPQTLSAETVSETVTRCFRAAVVGVIILPPLLGFYAVYLLLKVDPAAYRTRSVRRWLLIAWCINVVNIVGWLLFYRHVL